MPLQTAVILAAGLGSRLRGMVDDRPKGLIEIEGEPLVARSLRLLREAGVRRVVLVAGYRAEDYLSRLAPSPDVEIVINERFAQTGSLASLAEAIPRLDKEPYLLLESDLFYEARALKALLEHPEGNVVLASAPTSAGDEVWVRTEDGRIVDLAKGPVPQEPSPAEFVGINKVSSELSDDMARLFREAPPAEADRLAYETDGFVRLSARHSIHLCLVSDLQWGEIDNASHLKRVKDRVAPSVLDRESRLEERS